MSYSPDSSAFAILEQFLMGVLADIERGNMNREQALRMIMGPMKRWLTADPQGAVQQMADASADWKKATHAHRT